MRNDIARNSNILSTSKVIKKLKDYSSQIVGLSGSTAPPMKITLYDKIQLT